MTQKFANAARVELASTINDSDASLTITEGGALFPVADTGAAAIGPGADWFKLVLQDEDGIEVVYCRTHTSASNTFSNLLRGQDGTTARGFAATAVVGVRPLASDHDRFEAAALAAGGHAASTSNPHSVTKAQVGLSSVDNTSDASKPVSTATQTALNAKAPLASPAFTGTPTGITKAHVGLGNVDNTSDASKPVSTATQTALNAKAPLASPAFTGTPTGITKAHVGLGSVDNTSDASKPVSTATQTALNAKAPLASPTFTGTVSGVTKAMVGLGSVDNVSAASLRDRTTHTGVQDISTVSGLQAALDQISTKLKQRFTAGVDFTPGTSTTITLTETPIAPTKDSLQVYFDAGYQQESEWSYNSTTGVVTFTSAIPSGVSGVEATWGAALSAGVASSVVGQTDIGTVLMTASDAAAARTSLGISEDDLQWLGTPVGDYIAPYTAPPKDDPRFRYVLCTAGQTGAGGYNEGILINESVTGSGALIIANADIALADSPMVGINIPLINTDGRFVGAGEAEALENDTFQGHAVTNYASDGTGIEALLSGVLTSRHLSSSSVNNVLITDGVNGTPRTSDHTQPRTHRLPHYRRIL